MTEILDLLKKDVIDNMIKSGKREDGRGLDEYRPITLLKGVLNAGPDGSAMARLGKTQVLASVKFTIGAPYPDRPKQGVFITSAEFLPVASPEFESGPPRENAIELARVVDKGIRASEIIDIDSFFVEEGKVLTMFLDIYVLDHDGNLIDAAALASMGAITDTRLPKIEDGEIVWGEYDKPLDYKDVVTTSTFSKVDGKILLDADKNEETDASARMTVSFVKGNICALQKGLEGSFRAEEIEYIINKALEKSKDLKSIVLKA
ncbi:exosome complex protein Rrp42 [Candidatus Micrarchaeota archaeon]|nr:exosome complex protein Rrp42 [Candidatus Micrarchaeota archaeon]